MSVAPLTTSTIPTIPTSPAWSPRGNRRAASEERKARTAELLARASQLTGPERDVLIDEVIVINLPVARSLAARYRNRGQQMEELEQVASLALTRAVQNFDPARGEDLLVFVVPSVLGELKRYFRDTTWAVRRRVACRRCAPGSSRQRSCSARCSVGRRRSPRSPTSSAAPRPRSRRSRGRATSPAPPRSTSPSRTPAARSATSSRRRTPGSPTARRWRCSAPRAAASSRAIAGSCGCASTTSSPAGDRRRARRHPGAGLAPAPAHPQGPARGHRHRRAAARRLSHPPPAPRVAATATVVLTGRRSRSWLWPQRGERAAPGEGGAAPAAHGANLAGALRRRPESDGIDCSVITRARPRHTRVRIFVDQVGRKAQVAASPADHPACSRVGSTSAPGRCTRRCAARRPSSCSSGPPCSVGPRSSPSRT